MFDWKDVKNALAVATLLFVPQAATAEPPLRVHWDGLSILTGKTVSIAMPGGEVITGKAAGVEPDALLVEVSKTTHPKAYPKGGLRVPRATLRVLQMRTRRIWFRMLGTCVGGAAGLTAGTAAAIAIDWHANHGAAAPAALIGIGAAGIFAGYMAGNAADSRWTTIEILP